MKTHSLILLAFFVSILKLEAQIPFSYISQAPLLISPSFAGAKNDFRTNVITNYGNNPELTTNNAYLSADILSKKLYSGIGLYYLRTNVVGKTLNQEVEKDLGEKLSSNNSSSETQNSFGLCIAPKFKSSSHSLVLSPSIFTELGLGDRYAFIGNRYLYNQSYSSDFPNGKATKDSALFYTSNYTLNEMKLGLGILVNTSNFFIAIKSFVARGKVQETLNENHYSFESQIAERNLVQTIETLYRVNNAITAAYNFNHKGANEFSLTPTMGIGSVKYLNLGVKTSQPNSEVTYYYSQYLENAKSQINYLHLSLVARVNKVYFGYSYTQNEGNLYDGFVLGLQKEHFKFSSAIMAKKDIFFGELGFSYWF